MKYFLSLALLCMSAWSLSAQTNEDDTADASVPPAHIPRAAQESDDRWRKSPGYPRQGTPGQPQVLKLKRAPRASGESLWHREITLGLNQTRGNSDTTMYEAGAEFRRKNDGHRLNINLEGRYGTSDGDRTRENAKGEFRYEQDFSAKRYGAFDVQALYDALAALDYRIVWSLSHGWYLIRTEETVANVEIGPGYVQEKKDDEFDNYWVARIAESIEHKLNENVIIWEAADYMPNVSDFNQYIANAEIGVESFLTAQLRLRVRAQERYDSRPAEDKKKSDSIFSTYLVVNF